MKSFCSEVVAKSRLGLKQWGWCGWTPMGSAWKKWISEQRSLLELWDVGLVGVVGKGGAWLGCVWEGGNALFLFVCVCDHEERRNRKEKKTKHPKFL